MVTREDLEDLGVDVDGALKTVVSMNKAHHDRYPKGAKRHPLPDEKIRTIANAAVKGVRDKLEAKAAEFLAVTLKKAIE